MPCRWLFLSMVLLAGLGVCGCESAPEPWSGNGPRHILVLSNDSLRADVSAMGGNKKSVTPNVDALAKKSAVFLNHYSLVGSTHYSLRTMLTGTYPHYFIKAHPFSGKSFPPKSHCLPENLSRTGFVSANFYPVKDVPFTFNKARQLREIYYAPFIEKGLSRMVLRLYERDLEKRYGRLSVNTKIWLLEYQRPLIADFFAKYKNERVFAFVHSEDGHYPYRVLKNTYPFVKGSPAERQKALSWTLRDGHAPEVLTRFLQTPGNTDDKLDLLKGYYNSAISEWDRQVGLLLRELKRMGVLDDTLVVVTADHGEAMMEHGTLLHSGTIFPEEVHVPLVFAWKNGGAPFMDKKVAAFTHIQDIYPSLLSAGEMINTATLDGENLFGALLENRPLKNPATRFLGLCPSDDYYDGVIDKPAGVVENGRYLLTGLFDKTDGRFKQGDLFDLKSDPAAAHSIRQSQPDRFKQLKKSLLAFCDVK